MYRIASNICRVLNFVTSVAQFSRVHRRCVRVTKKINFEAPSKISRKLCPTQLHVLALQYSIHLPSLHQSTANRALWGYIRSTSVCVRVRVYFRGGQGGGGRPLLPLGIVLPPLKLGVHCNFKLAPLKSSFFKILEQTLCVCTRTHVHVCIHACLTTVIMMRLNRLWHLHSPPLWHPTSFSPTRLAP